MNRVTKRTWLMGLFILILLVGMLRFMFEYFTEADQWVIFAGSPHIYNNANIGCGTITCNYDGKNKHQTIIGGDDVDVNGEKNESPITLELVYTIVD